MELTRTSPVAFQNVEQALRKLDPSYNPNISLTDEQVISLAVAKVCPPHTVPAQHR
jgi:hypothetical protein